MKKFKRIIIANVSIILSVAFIQMPIIAEEYTYYSAGDVNLDGKVNSIDLILLKKAILQGTNTLKTLKVVNETTSPVTTTPPVTTTTSVTTTKPVSVVDEELKQFQNVIFPYETNYHEPETDLDFTYRFDNMVQVADTDNDGHLELYARYYSELATQQPGGASSPYLWLKCKVKNGTVTIVDKFAESIYTYKSGICKYNGKYMFASYIVHAGMYLTFGDNYAMSDGYAMPENSSYNSNDTYYLNDEIVSYNTFDTIVSNIYYQLSYSNDTGYYYISDDGIEEINISVEDKVCYPVDFLLHNYSLANSYYGDYDYTGGITGSTCLYYDDLQFGFLTNDYVEATTVKNTYIIGALINSGYAMPNIYVGMPYSELENYLYMYLDGISLSEMDYTYTDAVEIYYNGEKLTIWFTFDGNSQSAKVTKIKMCYKDFI